jgi:ParB family chromosome partitioning protein
MSIYRDKHSQTQAPNIAPPNRHTGVRQDVLHHIDLEQLRPSPDNPRATYPDDEIAQLADSLTALGQQEPITVYWSPELQAYQILSGHCRYFAAKKAGLASLAAVVTVEDLDKHKQLAKRLAENTARNDLHPLEYARSIQALMQKPGMTQEAVAKQLGRSQAWVSKQLALLEMPAEQQAKLAKGTVSITEARAAVVKQPRNSRKKPKQIKLSVGGLVVLVTFKRVADQCSATDALDRVRALAQQLDAKQAKDAA